MSNVLLVDDEQDIVISTALGLQNAGFEVHSFTNPAEALEHVRQCKECTLLVSDIKMPEISGFQLVKKIKELRPDMKVIMMTAFEIDKKKNSKLPFLLHLSTAY